jgi:hypothetical protein
MSTTPDALRAVMGSYLGGSDRKFRHPFNRRFIYTEGMKAAADEAGAYWLLDIVATEVAPVCFKQWDAAGQPGSMFVVRVKDTAATLELTFSDDAPPAWQRKIDYTDFPEGTWTFELAMDGIVAAPQTVLVMLLLQEH